MKSTQDLAIFIKELSEIRKAEMPVMIYPDKSFVIYEVQEDGSLEIIYSSSDTSDGLDINDLPYEDVNKFNMHMEELASIPELLEEASIIRGGDKYSEL